MRPPRMWWALPEPRIVTALMASFYVGCLLLGTRLWALPDWSGVLDWMSVLLIAGGLIGATACLAGQWWIERSGLILLGAAWAIRASMVMRSQPPEAWIQMASIAGVFVLLLTRTARIWGLPADPGRVLPEPAMGVS